MVVCSFPLLEKLSSMELAGTGTVRQNRLNKVPVKKKATLEKKNIPRGTSDVVYREDAVLVGWKDSKAVYCASNKYKGTSKSTCSNTTVLNESIQKFRSLSVFKHTMREWEEWISWIRWSQDIDLNIVSRNGGGQFIPGA